MLLVTKTLWHCEFTWEFGDYRADRAFVLDRRARIAYGYDARPPLLQTMLRDGKRDEPHLKARINNIAKAWAISRSYWVRTRDVRWSSASDC